MLRIRDRGKTKDAHFVRNYQKLTDDFFFVFFFLFLIFLGIFLTFHHTRVSLPSPHKGVLIFQLHHTRAFNSTAQGLIQTSPHEGFKLYRTRAFSDFTIQGLYCTKASSDFIIQGLLQSSPHKGFKLYRTRVLTIFSVILHSIAGWHRSLSGLPRMLIAPYLISSCLGC